MALDQNTRRARPAIMLSQSDHAQLERLARSVIDRNPEAGDQLLAELDRARIMPDNRLARDVVRMGSTLQFSSDGGEARTVTLVHPSMADISTGRISVLTPIGTALIGLKAGQSIDWTARDGRRHRLTVDTVDAPAKVAAT